MARYLARVPSPWPLERTFAFMADMREFARWDPNIRRVEQVTGDGGGADSVWNVVVSNVTGEMTLRYETVVYAPPSRVVVRARTPRMESLDEIRVEPSASGSVIVYEANLDFTGMLAPLSPLLGLVLGRIGDRASEGLRRLLAESSARGDL